MKFRFPSQSSITVTLLREPRLCITSQILSGMDPFFGDLDVTVVRRVLKGDRPPRPRHVGFSNRMWKMVKACWDDKPSRRLTVDEAVALIETEYLSPAP